MDRDVIRYDIARNTVVSVNALQSIGNTIHNEAAALDDMQYLVGLICYLSCLTNMSAGETRQETYFRTQRIRCGQACAEDNKVEESKECGDMW